MQFDPTAAIHHWNRSGVRSRCPWLQPKSAQMLALDPCCTQSAGSSTLEGSSSAAAAGISIADDPELSSSDVDTDFSFNVDDLSAEESDVDMF